MSVSHMFRRMELHESSLIVIVFQYYRIIGLAVHFYFMFLYIKFLIYFVRKYFDTY